MRILVTGDRFWTCPKLANSIVRRLVARYGPEITIILGGGPGVDSVFISAYRDLETSAEPSQILEQTQQNPCVPKEYSLGLSGLERAARASDRESE